MNYSKHTVFRHTGTNHIWTIENFNTFDYSSDCGDDELKIFNRDVIKEWIENGTLVVILDGKDNNGILESIKNYIMADINIRNLLANNNCTPMCVWARHIPDDEIKEVFEYMIDEFDSVIINDNGDMINVFKNDLSNEHTSLYLGSEYHDNPYLYIDIGFINHGKINSTLVRSVSTLKEINNK